MNMVFELVKSTWSWRNCIVLCNDTEQTHGESGELERQSIQLFLRGECEYP
eukprot:CAMPEP_0185269832 /NCGR_PEP_ID=MMETSP1359-20130426/40884_1 /TAXON_ID=552665 /ORGANISM="Bigelowiella longifila, Strain CCMP242" /LENGTH=50 /DNA_ID=CAMNT_0027861169 /DNA_START=22 /DNA_END=174 /DNA_ORIENTATION=+